MTSRLPLKVLCKVPQLWNKFWSALANSWSWKLPALSLVPQAADLVPCSSWNLSDGLLLSNETKAGNKMLGNWSGVSVIWSSPSLSASRVIRTYCTLQRQTSVCFWNTPAVLIFTNNYSLPNRSNSYLPCIITATLSLCVQLSHAHALQSECASLFMCYIRIHFQIVK